MHSKGNVVAMAITAIIITAAAAAFIVTFYGTPAPELPMSTALSETEISVKKAIALGISKWAETGFDQEEPMWYNNGDYPPSFDQAKGSLKAVVEEEIGNVLAELERQRGYKFEGSAKVEFPGTDNVSDITALSDEAKKSVEVKVSGFQVKDEKGSIVTVKEFATTQKFDYPVWDIYGKMLEWSTADMGDVDRGNFYLNLEAILNRKPYQFRFCDCGIIDKEAREEEIAKGKISWEEVEEEAIKPALESLKAKFASNPNIVCNYVVEKKVVENIPNVVKRGAAGCSCSITGPNPDTGAEGNPIAETIPSDSPYHTIYCWSNTELGKPKEQCQILNRTNVNPGMAPGQETTFTSLCETEGAIALVDDLNSDQKCTIFNTEECYTVDEIKDDATKMQLCLDQKLCFKDDTQCQQSYGENPFLDVGATHEVVGMTKRAGAVLRFECKDVQSRVGTETEFKQLSSSIVVRFALLKGSPPPEFCTTEAGPICKYGALVTLIGIECTPWDPCFLDAGDEAACGVCECMSEKQIIARPDDYLGMDDATANSWCKTQGGTFKCPSTIEAAGLTPACDTFQKEAEAAGKSLDCVLYSCDVVGDTVMRGCSSFTLYPTPCGDKLCKSCTADGFCDVNASKVGKSCGFGKNAETPSGKETNKGYSPKCFGCNDAGECVLKENLENVNCYSSGGCDTNCSVEGKCSVYDPSIVGKWCPKKTTEKYQCEGCRVSGSVLVCDSRESCPLGCCYNATTGWARCKEAGKNCCPLDEEVKSEACTRET